MRVNAGVRLTDTALLLQAAGDNKDVWCDLLRLFVGIFPEMVAHLEHVVAAEDMPNVARQAHCVKGCLYLVGAMCSAGRVEVIEVAACNGKVPCSRLEFEQLMDEMRCVINEVENDLNLAMRPSVEEIC